MRKNLVTLVALFVLLVPLLAACGGGTTAQPTTAPAEPTAVAAEPTAEPTAEPAAEPTAEATAEATDSSTLRVGLVTDLGKVNDGTFNQFAYEGAELAATEFGLEFNYIETQAQADYEKNIQTFVDEGYDVIVTVGFLIQDATTAAAAANPDIIFIGVDQGFAAGAATDNLLGLTFREDQAGFLAGALAAMMSESGTIGIVAGQEIPPVMKFKNGFDNGAKYVNPEINLLGVYLPTFIDGALGASTAQQMIGEGADVLFGAGGPTGTGAIKAAAENGVFVIGVDQDEYLSANSFNQGTAPGSDKVLSSAMKRVDVAVYEALKSVVDGTFKGNQAVVLDAAINGVGLAPFHDTEALVPDSVKAKLDEIFKALADGSLNTGVDPASGALIEAEIPEPNPYTP